jgi:uncharacterized membrane protein
MPLATIEWDKIGELVWVAPVAALVLSLAFSVLILAVSRADEARRARTGAAALAYGGLAVIAGVGFVGAVVYGVQIVVAK